MAPTECAQLACEEHAPSGALRCGSGSGPHGEERLRGRHLFGGGGFELFDLSERGRKRVDQDVHVLLLELPNDGGLVFLFIHGRLEGGSGGGNWGGGGNFGWNWGWGGNWGGSWGGSCGWNFIAGVDGENSGERIIVRPRGALFCRRTDEANCQNFQALGIEEVAVCHGGRGGVVDIADLELSADFRGCW